MGTCIKNIIFSIFLALPFGIIHGQVGEVEKDTTVYLPNDDVEVIKSFKARLANAHRINWQTEELKLDKKTIKYDYKTSVRKLDIEYLAPKIRPITLYPEQAKKMYNGFLRAAYGYPNAWLGDLTYSKDFSKSSTLGIRYSGQGVHGKKNQIQNFHWHDAHVFGRVKISDHMELNGGLDFQKDQRRFTFADSLKTQSMNQYGVNIGLQTPSDQMNSLKYYMLSSYHISTLSLYDYKENVIDVKAGLLYDYKNINTSLSNFSLILRSNDTTNIGAITQSTLSFSYIRKRNKYKIGIDHIYSENFGNKILPNFDFSFKIYQDLLFLGIRGKNKVGINCVRDLYQQNPYIAQFHSDNQVDFYVQEYQLSLFGQTNQLEYNLSGGYAIYWNVPFYTLAISQNEIGAHIVQNQDGKAPFVRYSLNYTFNESIKIGVKGEHYFISASENIQFSEWLNTYFEAKAKFSLIQNKLSFEPSFRLTRISTQVFESKNNRTIPELGFQMSYQVSDQLSGFIQGNNLLNNRSERYLGHPVVGTSLLLGIRYKW